MKKEEKIYIQELEKDLEHRDLIFSLLYDFLRSDCENKVSIIKAVVDSECWSDLNKYQKIMVEYFFSKEWRR